MKIFGIIFAFIVMLPFSIINLILLCPTIYSINILSKPHNIYKELKEIKSNIQERSYMDIFESLVIPVIIGLNIISLTAIVPPTIITLTLILLFSFCEVVFSLGVDPSFYLYALSGNAIMVYCISFFIICEMGILGARCGIKDKINLRNLGWIRKTLPILISHSQYRLKAEEINDWIVNQNIEAMHSNWGEHEIYEYTEDYSKNMVKYYLDKLGAKYQVFLFKNYKDAVMFKMRWGGDE